MCDLCKAAHQQKYMSDGNKHWISLLCKDAVQLVCLLPRQELLKRRTQGCMYLALGEANTCTEWMNEFYGCSDICLINVLRMPAVDLPIPWWVQRASGTGLIAWLIRTESIPVIHAFALRAGLGGGGGLRLAAPVGLIQVGLALSSSCMHRAQTDDRGEASMTARCK